MLDGALTSSLGRELLIAACFAFLLVATSTVRMQTAQDLTIARRAFRFMSVAAFIGVAALFTAIMVGSAS